MAISEKAGVVLAAIRAVEERDSATLMALYDHEVVFRFPPGLPFSGEWSGAGLARMTELFRDALEPVQPDSDTRRMDAEVLGEGEGGRVIVRYTVRGRAADGREFETPALADYAVREGRLTSASMFYFNPEGLRAFLLSASHSPDR